MAGPRRYDHDEARRRYQAGEPFEAIAVSYGVTAGAIRQIVTDAGREANQRATAAYLERHRVPCEECGDPCLDLGITGKRTHNPDGRILCADCRSRSRRERLRFNNRGRLVAVRCVQIDCANGERSQTPDNFTRGSRFRDVRDGGIHGSCRACQTRSRRVYRAEHAEAQRAYDRAYQAKRRALL